MRGKMKDLWIYLKPIKNDKFLSFKKCFLVFTKVMVWNFFNRRIWEGVYSYREQLPGNKDSEFSNDQWLVPLYLSVKKIRDDLENNRPIREKWAHRHLAMLAAALTGPSAALRILDIGGGMGGAYLYLLSMGIPASKLRYFIHEKEAVCAAGAPLLASYPGVSFHASLDEKFEPVDVVYISTSLQYFHNLGGLLSALKALKPRYILLTYLSAGEVPTFWTLQKNIPGIATPYRFFRMDELVKYFEDDYEAAYHEKIKNPYSMKNFPSQYRLKTLSHLLFRKKTD